MKFRSSVLVAVCLSVAVLASGPAMAGTFANGNLLYSQCQAAHGTSDHGACQGYIIGIFDALDETKKYGGIGGFRACAPQHINRIQVIDVMKQFLEKNPALRHFAASGLVAQALSEAWPCPKK